MYYNTLMLTLHNPSTNHWNTFIMNSQQSGYNYLHKIKWDSMTLSIVALYCSYNTYNTHQQW